MFHGDYEDGQALLLCDAPELYQMLEEEAEEGETPDPGSRQADQEQYRQREDVQLGRGAAASGYEPPLLPQAPQRRPRRARARRRHGTPRDLPAVQPRLAHPQLSGAGRRRRRRRRARAAIPLQGAGDRDRSSSMRRSTRPINSNSRIRIRWRRRLGIAPQFAALEMLVNPSSAELLAVDADARGGTLEIIPPEAPLVLFVWSRNRVAPVRVTEFSVTEEAFDPVLNPIRAKVSLGLRVLTTDDLGYVTSRRHVVPRLPAHARSTRAARVRAPRCNRSASRTCHEEHHD